MPCLGSTAEMGPLCLVRSPVGKAVPDRLVRNESPSDPAGIPSNSTARASFAALTDGYPSRFARPGHCAASEGLLRQPTAQRPLRPREALTDERTVPILSRRPSAICRMTSVVPLISTVTPALDGAGIREQPAVPSDALTATAAPSDEAKRLGRPCGSAGLPDLSRGRARRGRRSSETPARPRRLRRPLPPLDVKKPAVGRIGIIRQQSPGEPQDDVVLEGSEMRDLPKGVGSVPCEPAKPRPSDLGTKDTSNQRSRNWPRGPASAFISPALRNRAPVRPQHGVTNRLKRCVESDEGGESAVDCANRADLAPALADARRALRRLHAKDGPD